MAERYGWDANQVSGMTPAQLLIYCGEDAAIENELAELGVEDIRTDPRTGRRLARVQNQEQAMALLAKIEERKRRAAGT